jgi:undecaprenyl-diphosphatase
MDFLISGIAQYLVFIVAVAAIVTLFFSNKITRNRIIILAIFSFIFAFIISRIGGGLYYDPRPFVVEHTQPLFPYSPDNGFPSEHTLAAMVIASVMFVYFRGAGILFGIMGILIGIARVIAGVHHPIDIIGGIVIAIISTGISWLILRMIERNPNKLFQRFRDIFLKDVG